MPTDGASKSAQAMQRPYSAGHPRLSIRRRILFEESTRRYLMLAIALLLALVSSPEGRGSVSAPSSECGRLEKLSGTCKAS
jgi:hypothetical protein